MFAQFPQTPRGRSRFSKVLPTRPQEEASPSLGAQLPDLPRDKMMPPSMPHRHQQVLSRSSDSSLHSSYSDDDSNSPEPSYRSSNSSYVDYDYDSLIGADPGPDCPPSPPPKQEAGSETQIIDDLPDGSESRYLVSREAKFDSSAKEIWRRRSLKSNRIVEPSRLTLGKRDGSVAGGEVEGAVQSKPLPRSTQARKPVPVRQALQQPDLMGNRLAKLKVKTSVEDSLSSAGQHEVPPTRPYAPLQPPLLAPEYAGLDSKQNVISQPVSPLSPSTTSDDVPPTLRPTKSESQSTSSGSTARPTLASAHSRRSSETLTITSEHAGLRSSGPQVTTISAGDPSPYRRTPSLATAFPTPTSPIDDGAILPGPPLDLSHLDCYQSHRYMRSSENTCCPVACMICRRADNERRSRCTWCYLSACESCTQLLSSIPGKNLRLCLDRMALET